MELLNITIAAGETKHFTRAGRYIEIFDAASPVTLRFYDESGGEADNAIGAQAGIFLELAYKAFTLYSATAQTVLLLITDGRGGSRRQPGLVRVIDQATEKTVAGAQFFVSSSFVPVAAKFALISLAAATKRVSIKRLLYTQSLTGTFRIFFGTGIPNVPDVTAAFNPQSKLALSTAATAAVYSGSTVAAIPTVGELPGRIQFYSQQVAADQQTELTITTPIVLNPGVVLAVVSDVVNAVNRLVVDFEEG